MAKSAFHEVLKLGVNEGLVTEEAALEASTNPEQLRMNLLGVFLTETSAIVG